MFELFDLLNHVEQNEFIHPGQIRIFHAQHIIQFHNVVLAGKQCVRRGYGKYFKSPDKEHNKKCSNLNRIKHQLNIGVLININI